jgi:hypothetical protein
MLKEQKVLPPPLSPLLAITGGGAVLGATIGACINGNPVMPSAVTAGVGLAMSLAALPCLSFFRKPPTGLPTPMEAGLSFALLNIAGTATAYMCTKLFIDTAASAAPILDTLTGIPVTVGALFCARYLLSLYVERNSQPQYSDNSMNV